MAIFYTSWFLNYYSVKQICIYNKTINLFFQNNIRHRLTWPWNEKVHCHFQFFIQELITFIYPNFWNLNFLHKPKPYCRWRHVLLVQMLLSSPPLLHITRTSNHPRGSKRKFFLGSVPELIPRSFRNLAFCVTVSSQSFRVFNMAD